jgi:hypothetical protein
VDFILPGSWENFLQPLQNPNNWTLYQDYLPVYVGLPAWDGFTFGLPYVHMADVISREDWFYTNSVWKGRVTAPIAADPRRAFCTPYTFDKGSTTQYSIFSDQFDEFDPYLGTPVWTLIPIPGESRSEVVRIGTVTWEGGYFEWIHAGLTQWHGRVEAATETRTMTEIMNDLATATGDDPMAGSYVWPADAQAIALQGNFIPW